VLSSGWLDLLTGCVGGGCELHKGREPDDADHRDAELISCVSGSVLQRYFAKEVNGWVLGLQ